MTAEQIKEKIATLERNQQQALAQYQALNGAITAYKEILADMEAEAKNGENSNN